jgi:hypothetical protein
MRDPDEVRYMIPDGLSVQHRLTIEISDKYANEVEGMTPYEVAEHPMSISYAQVVLNTGETSEFFDRVEITVSKDRDLAEVKLWEYT